MFTGKKGRHFNSKICNSVCALLLAMGSKLCETITCISAVIQKKRCVDLRWLHRYFFGSSTPIMRLHRRTDGQTRARCFTLSGVVMASVKTDLMAAKNYGFGKIKNNIKNIAAIFSPMRRTHLIFRPVSMRAQQQILCMQQE